MMRQREGWWLTRRRAARRPAPSACPQDRGMGARPARPPRRRLLGPGADRAFQSLFRLWLPWLGKRFDAEAASGENVFDMSAYRAGERLTPAAYRAWWPEDESSYRALRFRTSVTTGRLDPGVEVSRIDYDLPENPPPLRRIVDELVAVQAGVYLGQAILRRGDGGRRLAWFTLE